MGALPRPAVSAGPHRELVEALHDLHHRAGWPSLRRIAAEAGCSHTTVSHILSSPRVPTWDHLAAVVEALGGDPDEFHRRWLALTSPTATEVPDVPLIGRQDELAAGNGFFLTSGRLLVVQGEAGSGKTRLLEALSASADRQVLDARCLPLSRGEPLMPLAAVLRTALRVDDGRWVTDALDGLPEFVAPALAVLVPELGEADPTGDVDGAFARHRLFTAACLLLVELDRRRPCVVVLDDLHWADDSTRDFLTFAITYDQGPPIACAWRVGDPDIARTADDWRTHTLGLPGVTTIPVGPLEEKESLAQLRWLGIDNPDTARALHQRSGGLPLFTEHLARAADTDALPDRLADLLTQRLRDLPHQARRVADTLALLDRPALATHLPDLTGLTHDDLTTGLHQLADRHLLQRATDAVALGHPLLAQAARERLLPTERHDHHRRLATALAVLPDPAPSEIAHHWHATGDTHHALPWNVRAALAAEQRFSLLEAHQHWMLAVRHWPRSLPQLDDPAIGRSTALLHALKACFQVDRTVAQPIADTAVAELDARPAPPLEAGSTLRYAAMLANAHGNPAAGLALVNRAADLLEDTPPSVVRIEVLSTQHFLMGALGAERDAKPVALLMAELSTDVGNNWWISESLMKLAFHAQLDGDVEAMHDYFRRSAPLGTGRAHKSLELIHVAAQRAELLLSIDAGADAVIETGLPALQLAQQWGVDTFHTNLLRSIVCRALHRAGRLSEVAELVDEFAHETPQPRHVNAYSVLAALDLARGRKEEALARARSLLPMSTMHICNDFTRAVSVGEIELWSGCPTVALERALSLLPQTRDTDAGWYAAELLAFAARAGADLVKTSPPSFDIAARLRTICDEAAEDPFAAIGTMPSRQAHHAQWLGELGRLDGRPNLEAWSTAIRHWDALERPFDAAYCRWRAAQGCIELGQATAAARLLRRGLKDARDHVPLRDALSTTLRDLTGA